MPRSFHVLKTVEARCVPDRVLSVTWITMSPSFWMGSSVGGLFFSASAIPAMSLGLARLKGRMGKLAIQGGADGWFKYLQPHGYGCQYFLSFFCISSPQVRRGTIGQRRRWHGNWRSGPSTQRRNARTPLGVQRVVNAPVSLLCTPGRHLHQRHLMLPHDRLEVLHLSTRACRSRRLSILPPPRRLHHIS